MDVVAGHIQVLACYKPASKISIAGRIIILLHLALSRLDGSCFAGSILHVGRPCCLIGTLLLPPAASAPRSRTRSHAPRPQYPQCCEVPMSHFPPMARRGTTAACSAVLFSHSTARAACASAGRCALASHHHPQSPQSQGTA